MTSRAPELVPGRVLVVDDAVENLNLMVVILERLGLEVVAAPSSEVALDLANRQEFDLALLDVLMPELDGYELCRRLLTKHERLPVIFISGRDEKESIVRAFEAGGRDYITKPIQEHEVIARVSSQLRLAHLSRDLEQRNLALSETNQKLKEQIEHRERAEAELASADARLTFHHEQEALRWGLEGFVGQSRVMRDISDEVRRLHAFSRTSVLVTGESGCGKELVARAIHHGSNRSGAPFIAVNCSAIPADLAESTFFGHTRGSFTGATSDRKGLFELAHRGTLFLDEIGDLPLLLQAKLLRCLEDGTFTPVGSGTQRKVDVRVLSATHRDLELQVEEGHFRQDLYFRLAQYVVRVPALRERREDIPLLVRQFLNVLSSEMNMRPPKVTQEALDALTEYGFPGNVRELKNVTERALITSGGAPIERRHLQLAARDKSLPPTAVLATLNIEEVLEELKERALTQARGNVSQAAKLLGVHRSWFYRRR